VELYRTVCEADLEGIVAKWKPAPYGTQPPSWIKIKNPRYSQAVGRRERLERDEGEAGGSRRVLTRLQVGAALRAEVGLSDHPELQAISPAAVAHLSASRP